MEARAPRVGIDDAPLASRHQVVCGSTNLDPGPALLQQLHPPHLTVPAHSMHASLMEKSPSQRHWFDPKIPYHQGIKIPEPQLEVTQQGGSTIRTDVG